MIELIEKFQDIQRSLVANTPVDFVRDLHDKIAWNSRMIGIVGPRGVGKTTMLLQHIAKSDLKKDQLLYLSADSVLLGNSSLFELAQTFYLKGAGKILYVDEVHRCKNWSQELKTIYDSLPKLQVVFSGSSQINILKGKADLSRRAAMYTIPGLSFREYLCLEGQDQFPIYLLEDVMHKHKAICQDLLKYEEILKRFNEYLIAGYYPYYKEDQERAIYYKRILNSTDKSIFEDIALVANLKTENMSTFKELLAFLSSISPEEVNVHKIAKNIGKKDDTVKNYLQILHDTGLLRFLPNSLSGHAKLASTEKIFFDNTNLLHSFCYFTGHAAEKGLVRETFIVEQLQSAGLIPLYSKDGDIKIKDFVLEIGGKSKQRKQIKEISNGYVVSDDIVIGSDRKIPLFLLGMLY